MTRHIGRTQAALMVAVVTMGSVAASCGDDDEGTTITTPTVTEATRLKANLTGGAETQAGDPDGSGTATITPDAAKGEVCYDVALQRIDTPVGMHIHEGAVGKSGGIVVPFTTPTSGDGSFNGCASADRALVGRIVANPDGFYLNVHTGPFPQGAVRGQLSRS